MSTQPTEPDLALWRRLAGAHQAWISAQADFFTKDVDRVRLLRWALANDDELTAFSLARKLHFQELMSLFDVWVYWAANSQSYIEVTHEIIKSLPRSWVIENIEPIVEPIVKRNDYHLYMMIFALYREIDRDLTLRLAKRALTHPESRVQSLGKHYLEQAEGASQEPS
jgi:hypothetical protein